jgi:hypothetical protein
LLPSGPTPSTTAVTPCPTAKKVTLDAGHLATEVTLEDPATFSRPFTLRFQSRLAQPGDELMEYICQENNQFGIASGVK